MIGFLISLFIIILIIVPVSIIQCYSEEKYYIQKTTYGNGVTSYCIKQGDRFIESCSSEQQARDKLKGWVEWEKNTKIVKQERIK